MEKCKYCGNEAFYPPIAKLRGWCCKERFYRVLFLSAVCKTVAYNKERLAARSSSLREPTISYSMRSTMTMKLIA